MLLSFLIVCLWTLVAGDVQYTFIGTPEKDAVGGWSSFNITAVLNMGTKLKPKTSDGMVYIGFMSLTDTPLDLPLSSLEVSDSANNVYDLLNEITSLEGVTVQTAYIGITPSATGGEYAMDIEVNTTGYIATALPTLPPQLTAFPTGFSLSFTFSCDKPLSNANSAPGLFSPLKKCFQFLAAGTNANEVVLYQADTKNETDVPIVIKSGGFEAAVNFNASEPEDPIVFLTLDELKLALLEFGIVFGKWDPTKFNITVTGMYVFGTYTFVMYDAEDGELGTVTLSFASFMIKGWGKGVKKAALAIFNNLGDVSAATGYTFVMPGGVTAQYFMVVNRFNAYNVEITTEQFEYVATTTVVLTYFYRFKTGEVRGHEIKSEGGSWTAITMFQYSITMIGTSTSVGADGKDRSNDATSTYSKYHGIWAPILTLLYMLW